MKTLTFITIFLTFALFGYSQTNNSNQNSKNSNNLEVNKVSETNVSEKNIDSTDTLKEEHLIFTISEEDLAKIRNDINTRGEVRKEVRVEQSKTNDFNNQGIKVINESK